MKIGEKLKMRVSEKTRREEKMKRMEQKQGYKIEAWNEKMRKRSRKMTNPNYF
jgi:hypothetical protein